MTYVRTLVLLALLSAIATPARADITGFLGTDTTPANRLTSGFAVGLSLLVVGFEFEYSDTIADASTGSPSLTTGMGNLLLQVPVPVFGFQPYFTVGGGIYKETTATHSDTDVGLNTGGGVKVTLVGPLRLRVDYRIFKLGSGALSSPAPRISAGLTLDF
jgi:opacity protein-like surface antigen